MERRRKKVESYEDEAAPSPASPPATAPPAATPAAPSPVAPAAAATQRPDGAVVGVSSRPAPQAAVQPAAARLAPARTTQQEQPRATTQQQQPPPPATSLLTAVPAAAAAQIVTGAEDPQVPAAAEPAATAAAPLAPPHTAGFYGPASQAGVAGGAVLSPRHSSSPLSSPSQRLQQRYVLPGAAPRAASAAAGVRPPGQPATGGQPRSATSGGAAVPAPGRPRAGAAARGGPPAAGMPPGQAAAPPAAAAGQPAASPQPSAAAPPAAEGLELLHASPPQPPSSSQPVDAPPLLGSSGVEEGEEGSWLGIGRGMGHPAPPLHPLRFASALPSTGSSGDASPGALPTHSGADSDVSHGFGSVVQLGSEPSSQHISPLARQPSLMAAAAAALGVDEQGQGCDGAEPAAQPGAGAGGGGGSAEPAAALPAPPPPRRQPGEALCAEEAEPVWEASLEPATSFQVVLKPLFGSTEDEASAFDLAVPQHEAGSPSAFFEQPPPQAQAWEQPTAAAEPARQVQEQAQAWEVQTVAQECAQQAAQAAPWDQAQQAAQGAEQQSGHAAGQHQPASLGSGLEPAAEPWAQQTAAAPWEQQQEQAAPWDEPKSFAAELLVPGPWQPAAAAGLALGQQAADSFFDDLSAETPPAPAAPGPDVPVAGLSAGWQAEGAGCSWDAGDGSLTDAAPAATLWGQAAAMPFERTASDAAWPADAVAYMAAAAAAQPGGPASSTWGNAAEGAQAEPEGTAQPWAGAIPPAASTEPAGAATAAAAAPTAPAVPAMQAEQLAPPGEPTATEASLSIWQRSPAALCAAEVEPEQQPPTAAPAAAAAPDALDLDAIGAAGGADAFLHEQEAMPACDLQDICSPTAADEAAAEGFGFAGAAPEVQQDLAAGGAFFAGTAGKQPAATAAAGASGGQQTEPTTWCDDAGYCWCDAADGWRYWWDAGSQQWQQHSRTPAAAGSEGGAAASEQQQRQVPEPAVEQQQSELQQQQQHQPQPEQPDAAALPAASSGMGDVAAVGAASQVPPAVGGASEPATTAPAEPALAAVAADELPVAAGGEAAALGWGPHVQEEAVAGASDWADSFGLPPEEAGAAPGAEQQVWQAGGHAAQPVEAWQAADAAPPSHPWQAAAEAAPPTDAWQAAQEEVQQVTGTLDPAGGTLVPEPLQQWQPPGEQQPWQPQPAPAAATEAAPAMQPGPPRAQAQPWQPPTTAEPLDAAAPDLRAWQQQQQQEEDQQQPWRQQQQQQQQPAQAQQAWQPPPAAELQDAAPPSWQQQQQPWQPQEAAAAAAAQPWQQEQQPWQPGVAPEPRAVDGPAQPWQQERQPWQAGQLPEPQAALLQPCALPSVPPYGGAAASCVPPTAVAPQQHQPATFQPAAPQRASPFASPPQQPGFASYGSAAGFASYAPGHPGAGAAGQVAYGGGGGPSAGGYPLHSRPPSPFCKLLFGGRLLMVAPSGQLQLHPVARTPAQVLQPLPGAPTCSLAAHLAMLESFPGPLTSSTKQDKVAKFCAEQATDAAAEADDISAAGERRTLWSVLRVLALHQGRISSAPYSLLGGSSPGSGKQPDPASLPEVQLAAALLEGADGSGHQQVLARAAAPASPAVAEAAVSEVQQLLLQGRRADALRVASEAQLWPVALLLARLLGDAAIAATAAAMAEQSVAEGAPLQTLLLLLGGAPADGALTAAAQAAAAGPAAAAAPAAAALWQQPGVFNPAAVAASATASSSGDAWRQHLAVIAANRTPGDEAAMLVLGSALFAAGRLLPAHTCCVLAGALLQPWDLAAAAAADAPAAGQAAPPMVGSKVAPAAPPLVLLGVDAMAQPRSLAQLPRILQTEVFTWSRTVGNTSLSGQYLPVVPYKLLHAAALAELGLVQQASAYLAAMNATLQALGGKVPPGLLVCRAVTLDLADRLQQYAAGQKLSLGGTFSAGALVSSVSKWLDRGLSAIMMGGSDAGSEAGRHSRRPSHSRNPSTGSIDGKDAPHRRSGSSASVLAGGRPHSAVPSAAPSVTASPPPAAPLDEEGGKKGGGLFHRVKSITSLLGPKPGASGSDGPPPAPAPAPPSEPGNVFYYDHDLKMWRERGVEPPPPPEPVAPPPTAAAWQAPPPTATASTPPLPPTGCLVAAAPHNAVGSRYALAGSYGTQQAAAAAFSLVPQAPGCGGGAGGPPTWHPSGAAAAAQNSMPSGAAGAAGGLVTAAAAPLGHAAPAATPPPFMPPGAAAPAAAAPPAPPTSGLRIAHTRALSADSSGSGLQPGTQFADGRVAVMGAGGHGARAPPTVAAPPAAYGGTVAGYSSAAAGYGGLPGAYGVVAYQQHAMVPPHQQQQHAHYPPYGDAASSGAFADVQL